MICDTSGLIAAFATDQKFHDECARVVLEASVLVVPPLVLAELHHMIASRTGPEAAIRAIRAVHSGPYEIAPFDEQVLRVSLEIMDLYRDLPLGLTDSSIVAIATRYSTDEILTLDRRHFRAVRSLSGRAFRLLPWETA